MSSAEVTPNHRVHWRKYLDIDEHPNAENFLKEHGDVALLHVLEIIEHTYDTDVDVVDVIYFEEQNIVCEVYREEYTELLNATMKWYIKTEDYEICAYIKQLIEKIEADS